jgi:hypothetical protein
VVISDVSEVYGTGDNFLADPSGPEFRIVPIKLSRAGSRSPPREFS